MIGDFLIVSRVLAESHEVCIEQWITGDDFIKGLLEVRCHSITQQLGEPTAVFVVHKSISEHTLTLVVPQPQKF